MTSRLPLSRDPEFLKYWASETIATFGGPIAGLALPLTAIVLLSAGPAEMGALGAARNLPFLFFGLAAGVVVDRLRRQPLIVVTAFGEAALLLLVPFAATLGLLRIELLYVVAFGVGSLGVFAVVAYQSLLPTLVGRDRLVGANGAVRASDSAGQIAGPGIGGLLVELLSAPIAVLGTAITSAISGLLLMWVHMRERAPVARRDRPPVWSEVREGLEIVLADRHLRSIMLCGATHNVFSNGMLVALYVLFATERLGLSAAELGLVFAIGGPGSLLGSVLAARVSSSAGLGPTIGAMQLLTGIARLMMPLAALLGPAVLILGLGEFVLGVARAIFNVNQLSLRQAITPDHQQGRMNASIRFLMWSVVPIGALLGGSLGEAIGLIPTIWIGVTGTFAASLWIFLSPVWSLRERPEPLAVG